LEILKSKGLDVVIPCIGSYNGETEDSYIVPMSEHGKVMELAREYNQESVLIRYADGECYLYFLDDGSMVELGKLVPVSEGEAKESDSYTYRPDLGTYYVTKGGL
jgi:hypothetical protein